MSFSIVKQELHWENSGESFGMDCAQGVKPDFNVEVKVEPLWSDGVTASPCADHVVEDELMLRPEEVEIRGSNKVALGDCYVRLERITQHACDTRALLSYTHPAANQPQATSNSGATSERHTRDTKETYMCDFCGKMFIHKCNLILHIQFHKHDESKHKVIKLRTCEICEKQFKEKGHLNRHYRIHTGEKPYACDVCNKKYTRLDNLRNHNCVHAKVKNKRLYPCEICNKKFSRKMTLKIHKRIHSGQKPYTCEICNQQYAQSSNITRHMRTHTGEMPYSCDTCGKKFSRLSNMNEHIEVHSGKKYSCTICERQFTRFRTLKMHEKKYHS